MTTFRPFLFPVFEYADSPLALRPPLVAGMTYPIVDGDGGISIAVVEDNELGVLCVINPYSHMQAGDKIDIYLDTVLVFHIEVLADNVDQRLFFYLSPALFVPGWIEEFYYRLQRKDELAPDDPSTPLRLLTKLDRPGGRDKDPHLPGHSELKIVELPEEVKQQGVDAKWAANGVPMTILRYPNIALHDTIQVRWGSVWLKPHRVTQPQVDGTDPIVIIADQKVILDGGDSAALLVQYDVYDQVWNYSEKWSLTTTVKVEAGAWHLEAPIIKESFNGVIDLKQLNQQDVTVQVQVRDGDFDYGDTITLTWIGTPLVGKPLIYTVSWTIDNIPSIHNFKVPYADVRAIAMGSADASYVLIKKNGGPPLSSKLTFARVIGDVYAHPAPKIRELVGSVLEPDNTIATLDITYPGMANGDHLILRWLGTRADNQPYLHEEEYTVSQGDAERKIVTIYFGAEHISPLVNGKLDLSYTVFNDQLALYGVSESEHLLVDVRVIAATLPAPSVVEADGDVLDPSKVFDNATVLVGYLGTARDDILTYYWSGVSAGTSTSDWLPITSVIAEKPVRFRVDAWFVSANIGQYVKVRYTLKHASTGLTSYSATLKLLIGELVGDLPPPEVIQAPEGTLDPMNALTGVDVSAKYTNMDPSLDTIALKFRGTPGAGTSEDLEQPGDASGEVLFHLPASVVGPNIGRSVAITHDVKRYNFWNTSDLLTLDVLRFQDPENQLPRPQVPQDTDGVLDLMLFAGNANITVKVWPFISLKQRVWLRLEGKTTSGSSYSIELLKGVEITQPHLDNGLNETLPRLELLKLGHSLPASVVCKVTFDGDTAEHTAIEFPVLSLTIRTRYDYLRPFITKVMDSRSEVPEGGITRDDEVTLEGTATRDETIELFDETLQSHGTAKVGIDGKWTRKISNLTEITWRITAKALYDAEPVSSPPRTFTVDFAITPDLTSITDSKGEVTPDAITYDNSVLVEGIATRDERVRLLEGATPVVTLDVDGKGEWRHRYDGLTVKTYSLRIEALYDVDPTTSPPRTFVVGEAVTPTISSVMDIRGSINNGGTTYYRLVNLEGKASKNEEIELWDGTTKIDVVKVDPEGIWKSPFPNLTLKGYSLKAKAMYGSQPVSDIRTFTVAAQISPTITAVSDSKGPVAPGAITYDSTVTLRGAGTPREQVHIYNNNSAVGSAVNVGTDGQWTTPLGGLAVRNHSVFARALYEVTPIDSEARSFTVAAHTAPRIDSVSDANGEVQNGGQTKSTTVNLRGIVTPGHQVQIHDNNNPKHTVTASGNTWTTSLAVSLGGHTITAKAVSTGQLSNARSFTVISPIPPFNFNTSPVTLSGKTYIVPGSAVLPAFNAGNSVRHQASGGQPGYTYISSNQNVAAVDGTGLVTVRGRGQTTITARDVANQYKSYTVTVTGVIHCIFLGNVLYRTALSSAAAQGARIPNMAELHEMHLAYGARWPGGTHHHWSTDPSNYWWPFPARKAKHIASGAVVDIMEKGYSNVVAIR